MKSVKVIQAHKDHSGLWELEDKNYLTTAAGFVIEDHVDDWTSVAIAYAEDEFPDAASKLIYIKSVKIANVLMHSYHYDFIKKQSSRDGRKNSMNIFLTNDIEKLFRELPKRIYFKIFKI